MERIILRLAPNWQSAHKALVALCAQIKPWVLAGYTLTIEVFDGKSREQERLYHSCFRDLARDCKFQGGKVDEEVWKRALISAFYTATKDDPEYAADWRGRAPRILPNLDGNGFFSVEVQSSKFTKKLASGFITFVHATGDERGVRWSRTSLGRDVPDEVSSE